MNVKKKRSNIKSASTEYKVQQNNKNTHIFYIYNLGWLVELEYLTEYISLQFDFITFNIFAQNLT